MPKINRVEGIVKMAMAIVLLGASEPAHAQNLAPGGATSSVPFTATLSNNTPLAIGMDAEDATRALGGPLKYISGGPGDEIYLAYRNMGGSGLFSHKIGFICNSARAAWLAGKAIGAITGCGNSEQRASQVCSAQNNYPNFKTTNSQQPSTDG